MSVNVLNTGGRLVCVCVQKEKAIYYVYLKRAYEKMEGGGIGT